MINDNVLKVILLYVQSEKQQKSQIKITIVLLVLIEIHYKNLQWQDHKNTKAHKKQELYLHSYKKQQTNL